jgi:hypothetical protein
VRTANAKALNLKAFGENPGARTNPEKGTKGPQTGTSGALSPHTSPHIPEIRAKVQYTSLAAIAHVEAQTMSIVMNRFADDAARIRTSGKWAAMNAAIKALAAPPGAANTWQVEVLGGLCFQVFNEYLRLQDAASAERLDPSLLAWRARNLLELSVWATYFGRSRDNARRLYEDAGRDVKDLLEKMEKAGQAADSVSVIAEGKNDLLQRAANEGIETLDGKYMRVDTAANECGLKDLFNTMNKLLSKFTHPTAMQILGTADEAKQTLQRDVFYGLGCLFFIGAFTALENSLPFIGQEPEITGTVAR